MTQPKMRFIIYFTVRKDVRNKRVHFFFFLIVLANLFLQNRGKKRLTILFVVLDFAIESIP